LKPREAAVLSTMNPHDKPRPFGTAMMIDSLTAARRMAAIQAVDIFV